MDGTAKRGLSKERLLRGMVTGEKEEEIEFRSQVPGMLEYWFEFQLGLLEIELSGRDSPNRYEASIVRIIPGLAKAWDDVMGGIR